MKIYVKGRHKIYNFVSIHDNCRNGKLSASIILLIRFISENFNFERRHVYKLRCDSEVF